MGREPFNLTVELWKVLAQYRLVRTVQEEENRRYNTAEAVSIPKTRTATLVDHLLRACLRACSSTETLNLEFVDVGEIEPDLYIFGAKLNGNPLVRIDKRWLSMDYVRERMRDDWGDVVIYCAVDRLFGYILHSLPPEVLAQNPEIANEDTILQEKDIAFGRMTDYYGMKLRIVQTMKKEKPGLGVEWRIFNQVFSAASNGAPSCEGMFEIQCHRASRCFHLRNNACISADGTFTPWLRNFLSHDP